jgi:hypothetical protein
MESNTTKFEMPPEKVLEITNAINAAIVAGKTVTLDDGTLSIQVAGAIPGWGMLTGVFCISNEPESRYIVKIIDAKGQIIRAYFPEEKHVDIIHNPLCINRKSKNC